MVSNAGLPHDGDAMKCPVCGASRSRTGRKFWCLQTLLDHVRQAHPEFEVVQCPVCGEFRSHDKRWFTRISLVKHMADVHWDRERFRLNCPICQSVDVTIHLGSQTKRHFDASCNECGATWPNDLGPGVAIEDLIVVAEAGGSECR